MEEAGRSSLSEDACCSSRSFRISGRWYLERCISKQTNKQIWNNGKCSSRNFTVTNNVSSSTAFIELAVHSKLKYWCSAGCVNDWHILLNWLMAWQASKAAKVLSWNEAIHQKWHLLEGVVIEEIFGCTKWFSLSCSIFYLQKNIFCQLCLVEFTLIKISNSTRRRE